MKPRPAVSLALRGFTLVGLLLMTAFVAEAQVKILYPTEGSAVHGIVTVEATKSDPGDGWIAFRVLPTNQKYLMATAAPAHFQWNTQARAESGKQIYPDGQYTIEAAGYDGSGRERGKASVKVQVRNTVSSSELGGQVLLRAHFNRADVFLYEMEATQVVDVPGEAGNLLRNPPMMSMGGGMGGPGGGMMGAPPMMGGGMMGGGMMGGGMMGGGMGMGQMGIPTHIKFAGDARWTAEVLTPSVTGRAIVDYDLKRGYYLVSWLWPKKWNVEKFKLESNVPDSYTGWLPGAQVARPSAGQFYRFKVYANGELVQMHEGSDVFPMGQFYVELPPDPVGVGSTWEGKMAMITGLTDEETSLVEANFKLESFEYFQSYRCARLSATHTETGVQIPWDLPGNPVPSTGMGMGGAPGMGGGPPALGGPGGMGPAGGAMMPGPPGMAGGMGGMGGMGMQTQRGPDGEPAGTLKGDVTITRIAYFAIDAGRFVAFEDTVKKQIKKILAPPLMTGGMGMGGGMMGGGMMGGGMMGGGMMGGGMMGGGMGMMQKLEYRSLYDVDVGPFLGALVGAGGSMSMGGGLSMGGGIGAPPPPGGGMAPGAMPWAGGMGAGMGGMGGGMGMGMQAPVKATVNIDTTLKVHEVRQVAGHTVAQSAG